MRRLVVPAVCALVGALTAAVVVHGQTESPSSTVLTDGAYDCDFEADGFICTAQEVPTSTTTPAASTSSEDPSTTTAPTETSTIPPSSSSPTTTAAPSSTTSTQPSTTSSTSTSTSTTVLPTTTTPPPGVAFSEDFSAPTAFSQRFDHGWSGELHAGGAFGADRDGWRMDHDMACGNPNTTSHVIHLDGGHIGEDDYDKAANAFMQCAPAGDAAKAHLMTAANTEGYIIAWFSPKQTFTAITRVCVDVNMNYIGNGQWWQMVFLTNAEATRRAVWDGQQVAEPIDLGYTSPDFPNNNQDGPTTPQGTAGAGVKFLVASDTGQASNARFVVRPWDSETFRAEYSVPASTTDKAPRYPVCVEDIGTQLRITVTTPQGGDTRVVPGNIPADATRVVFEHDEYNPDKHFSNAGEIDANSGPGYTIHWDNVQIS